MLLKLTELNAGKSSRKVAINSLPVLSRHRTCRSAYGGFVLLANDKYCNSRSGLTPYSVMNMPDTLKNPLRIPAKRIYVFAKCLLF